MNRALSLLASALVVAGLVGCGGPTEFARETKYTPESLAQEFAFRYKELPARASARKRAINEAREKARSAVADVDAQTKSARSEAATKSANAPTLERLIADVDAKLAQVPGMSRADAGKKFVEALGQDKSIDPADLAEIGGRLAK